LRSIPVELWFSCSLKGSGFSVCGLGEISTCLLRYWILACSASVLLKRSRTRYDDFVPIKPVFHFRAEQFVPFPVELVFAFFANPQNLPSQRPLAENPSLRFRSMAAGAGTEMDISFSPIPFVPGRLGWHGIICEFEWNKYFIDEQQKGFFARWRHAHRFRAESRPDPREDHKSCLLAGTVVTDELEYALPLGPFGLLANALFVRRQLEATFACRQQRLAEILPVAARHAGL
jgi:ligand-binding SRPBCC domain-containing protein